MTERVFSLIFEQDDVTWQSLLVELVREEGMDPWDIDISKLADRYRELVSHFTKFDVRISAKVVLAAALLLRLKSTCLLEKDISGLDALIASTQPLDELDSFYDHLEEQFLSGAVPAGASVPELVPRTPQPRKRKVSLDDLMGALRKALEVQQRRVLRLTDAPKVNMPVKARDITEIIMSLYNRIVGFIKKEKRPLTFAELIPSEGKADKIMTFIPLLHLATPPHGKIDLLQRKHFGTIEIVALDKKAVS